MVEMWKPIPLAGAKYEVSDWGNVRNCAYTPPRLMQAKYPVQGHKTVRLVHYEHGPRKLSFMSVPRLVAQAFLPPSEHAVLAFKDGDRDNCRADNLEWRARHSEPKKSRRPPAPTISIDAGVFGNEDLHQGAAGDA